MLIARERPALCLYLVKMDDDIFPFAFFTMTQLSKLFTDLRCQYLTLHHIRYNDTMQLLQDNIFKNRPHFTIWLSIYNIGKCCRQPSTQTHTLDTMIQQKPEVTTGCVWVYSVYGHVSVSVVPCGHTVVIEGEIVQVHTSLTGEGN